jgi:uncharacterized protein (UPF0335 family)
MSKRMNVRERLVYNITHLERLGAEVKNAGERLRDAFKAAQFEGFDPPTIKAVLKLRKLTPHQRAERRALEAIYLASLGMLEGEDLPDVARRRLDQQGAQAPKKTDQPNLKEARKQDPDAPPAPSEPQQPPLIQKDPEEARAEGKAAGAAGKRIYDNPYRAGDPCRAAWDEGWCSERKSNGMDTPEAFQRKKPAKEEKSGDAPAGKKSDKKDKDDEDEPGDSAGGGSDQRDGQGA